MIRSLRGRVVAALAGVAIAVLGAYVAVVFFTFRDRLRSDLDTELADYGRAVTEAVGRGASLPEPPLEGTRMGAVVLGADGSIVDTTGGFETELEFEEEQEELEEHEEERQEELEEAEEEGKEEGEDDENDSSGKGGGGDDDSETASAIERLIVAARPGGATLDLRGEHGTPLRAWAGSIEPSGQIVAVLAPASSSGGPVRQLMVVSVVTLGVAILLVILMAWWAGGFAVRPLRFLAGQVRTFDESSLHQRVDVPAGAEEVADVARSINSALDRIETSLARERAFVADASHELRNPLASLRGELELSSRSHDPDVMRSGIEGAIEETDRLASLADDLLLLARAESGNLVPTATSLVDIAGSAVVRQANLVGDDAVSIELTGDDHTVLAVEGLAQRAVENLIENAMRHSPSGGVVTVSMWSEGERAGVDVIDRGPGIPAGDREVIFQRFARSDGSRTRAAGGTGLGLAIVAAVMRAMGGEVDLSSGDAGRTTFRLSFRKA